VMSLSRSSLGAADKLCNNWKRKASQGRIPQKSGFQELWG
jgi:hypothetical protein